MEKKTITTKKEARQYAIEWQQWASERNLSYSELLEWQDIFKELALEFGLEGEFQQNGII